MLLSCEAAAAAVKSGDIIAYPTEAVYGLGCDPNNLSALQALLELKNRDADKGLILVASDWQQLEPFIDPINVPLMERAKSSWPGPVTWIMPASKHCSSTLTGGRSTIAVRISAHSVVNELCRQCGHALVSTSANISGRAPLASTQDITDTFGSSIAGVVSGELGGLKSATSIFDASTGEQLR